MKRKIEAIAITFIHASILLAVFCNICTVNIAVIGILLFVIGIMAYSDSTMLHICNLFMTFMLFPSLMIELEKYINITNCNTALVSMLLIMFFLVYLPAALFIKVEED